MASNKYSTITVFLFFIAFLIVGSASASAQDKPVFTAYKNVAIGASESETREKLGKPKDESKTELSWEFADDESARIVFDEEKKVRTISVTYNAKKNSAPGSKQIIGEELQANPDGSMFKMVQYPDSGFWISYVRTGGDDPLVIVTMQKIFS